MKIIKFILKTLLVLIFICSVTVNILLFGNSYGTLVIKKDTGLLKSMSFNFSNLMYEEATANTEERGYKYTYKVEEDGKTTENYEYKVYFDEENNFHMTYTYNDGDDNESTFYITKSKNTYTLYTDTENSKTKKELTTAEVEGYKDDIIAKIYDMSYLGYVQTFAFKEKDIKTTLGFSFSPFYFLGIKVNLNNETKTDYVLHYDLNGNLRKAQIIEENKETTMTFSFDDSKIKFPSFKPYSVAR